MSTRDSELCEPGGEGSVICNYFKLIISINFGCDHSSRLRALCDWDPTVPQSEWEPGHQMLHHLLQLPVAFVALSLPQWDAAVADSAM